MKTGLTDRIKALAKAAANLNALRRPAAGPTEMKVSDASLEGDVQLVDRKLAFASAPTHADRTHGGAPTSGIRFRPSAINQAALQGDGAAPAAKVSTDGAGAGGGTVRDPRLHDERTVAVLRARAIEAAAEAQRAHARADADRAARNAETADVWARARTFNRTGGRR